MKLYALHGFLGLPSDWNFLNIPLEAVDLFKFNIDTLFEWGLEFNSSISTSANILLGYSLGGRLVLHALMERPSLWEGAILVSTHPGLNSQEEKEARLKEDLLWADRFLIEPWDDLMQEWNRLPVFKDSWNFPRKESDFSRKQLAGALTKWSLGRQIDMRAFIRECPLPILWLVGEGDEKFTALAKRIQFNHPLSSIQVLPRAGHRVPWDAPDSFQEAVATFIKTIQQEGLQDERKYLARD